jgi:hypothetical protein
MHGYDWILSHTKVSFQRMVELLQGAPPATLVGHNPLYLSGPVPELKPIGLLGEQSLDCLEATRTPFS